MLTELNLSEEEIRMLNYERYYYPCPKIRKRLHVLYLRGTTKMRNKQIGLLLDVHPNSVSRYIKESIKQTDFKVFVKPIIVLTEAVWSLTNRQ